MTDPINSTSAASLPVVAWRYRWKAPREALTPHAPAQAQIDALRIENERLSDDNAICRDAIAHALELVEAFAASPDGDDDMSQGAARATRRRLNEALGKMEPRLMMEREMSPKYGLLWKELRAENERLSRELAEAREEIAVDDKLLETQYRLMDAIPGCPIHGNRCVPHAVEWVNTALKAGKEPRHG